MLEYRETVALTLLLVDLVSLINLIGGLVRGRLIHLEAGP
jgi:hypothetical protein